jgi:hypothetical protein
MPHTDDMLTGVFGNDTFTFFMEEATPHAGMYHLELISNNSEVVFACYFNMSLGFNVQDASAEWYHLTQDGAYISSNSITNELASSIRAVKINLILKNTKDIPYPIGENTQVNIPLSYNIEFFKNGETDPIFSSENITFARADCSFREEGPREAAYFEPSETIQYTNNINDNTFSRLEPGKYFILGQVKIGNLTYDFSIIDNLEITGENQGTPGFEFVLVLFATAFIIFALKREKIQ